MDEILVLGIGNLLWGDEGFGVRMVEALHERHVFPDNVRMLDGGTQGLYLVQYVQQAKRMIVFDAVDYGLEPGKIKLARNGEVPEFMHAGKMSLHQAGFQEVLATAKFTGKYPEKILLIGVQPRDMEDYGGSLTSVVKEKMNPCMEIALDQLEKWGAKGFPRIKPLEEHERLNAPGLSLSAYESERPEPEQACRVGDARWL